MPYAHITGWGMAVPDTVLTNDELALRVIPTTSGSARRTGIRERHIAKTASFLRRWRSRHRPGAEVANLKPTDIDLIICATSSPEYIFPATACLIQDQLGASKAGAFDLSGRMHRIHLCDQHGRAGHPQRIDQERPGHRRGDAFALCRLGGPQHLHPLWRWGGSVCVAGQRQPRRRALGRDALRRLRWDLLSLPGGGSHTPPTKPSATRWPALHPYGRARGLPVCHACHGSRRRKEAGVGWPHNGRCAMDHPAPGQLPHHRDGCQVSEDAARSVCHQCRSLRQYVDGLHTDRHRGSVRKGPDEERGQDRTGRLRSGADMGRAGGRVDGSATTGATCACRALSQLGAGSVTAAAHRALHRGPDLGPLGS